MSRSHRAARRRRLANRASLPSWELGVGIVVAIVAVAFAHYYDSFEWFASMSRAHENYELDELLVLFVVATVMLAIFSVRRSRALTAEVVRSEMGEARFAALFAASPYPIGVFSLKDGAIVDANVTALRAAGMARENLVGRPMRELSFWDAATADELLRRMREKPVVRAMEIVTYGDPSGPRPVLISAQTLELDGEPCFIAAMSDITELRAAERASAASDAELLSLFRAMQDVVMVLGRDGRYLKVPTTNADLLYRTAPELVGKLVHDVLPTVEADAICVVIRQALDARDAVGLEYKMRIGERDVWFSAVVTPLDEDRVVWVARDVTEELETRQSLRESEAQYRLLFDRNPQPMFVSSVGDQRYLDVNDAAVRHYGYSHEEFLTMTAADIRPLEDVPSFRAQAATEWPTNDRRLFRHRKRTGEVIDVEITRDSITYQGQPARLVLSTDVTERLRVSRELERSLSLQRATLEATADGILVVDQGGRIESWNGKFAELWNLPTDTADAAVVQRAFADGILGAVAAAPLADATAPASHRPVFDLLQLADGRFIERYSQPKRLGDEDMGRVWSFRDVTQRERATAQRKILTDRFEAAFGDAPIGMTMVSPDGRWVEVNAAMCHMLGRTPDDLLGKSAVNITHPDDIERSAADFAKLRSGAVRTIRVEKRYLHSSGRVVLTLVNATMLSGGGSAPFVISQILDITEQRAAEERLRRQALVFETMSEAVVVCDADRRVIDANLAAETIFGYPRDELLGRTPDLWQRADSSPSMREVIDDRILTAGVWSGEYGFVTKDGHTGIGDATITELRNADGTAINRIAVIRDVTERRQMERHLLQAQRFEAIGSLAGGIAHEINTPTQYIGDNVRFLGDGVVALSGVVQQARVLADAARARSELADAVVAFDRIVLDVDVDYLMSELPLAAAHSGDGCDRITDIVKAMQGFSHPDGTQKRFVDLNAAMRDTVTVCRNEWKYVATLTTELDATMPPVPCLPGELQQVVLNLIVNAAQAIAEVRRGSGELGHITLSTRLDGRWAEIGVQDDGGGIPESIRGKVFDPFFTTKAVGSGMGQGLSLGHASIVRKHQGTLTFESVDRSGTTFIIRLPLDGGIEVGAVA